MKGFLHPSVVAFGILVIVCGIGVYIIRSARFKEDFFVTVNVEACNKEYTSCKETKANCENTKNTCLKEASSNKDPALAKLVCNSQFEMCKNRDCEKQKELCLKGPQFGASAATSAVGAGTYKPTKELSSLYTSLAASALEDVKGPVVTGDCKSTYDDCIAKGGKVGDCYNSFKSCEARSKKVDCTKVYAECIDEGKGMGICKQREEYCKKYGIRSDNDLTTLLLSKPPSTVPTPENIQRIEGKELTVPGMDQGNTITFDEFLSTYGDQIKPKPITPTLDTDRGTLAEKITKTSGLSPSMRDMIRREVADVVRDELDAAEYYNPNEVRYA